MTGTKNAAVKSRKKKRGPGRPTVFTQRVVRRICESIEKGNGVEAACKDKNGKAFVDWTKFYNALTRVPAFSEMYARACRARADAWAERAVRVASECRIGQIVTDGPKGVEVKTADMVDRARLEVDTIKWMIARANPRKYGDRLEVAGDPDRPLSVTAAVAVVMPSMEAFRESLRQVIAGKKPEKAP